MKRFATHAVILLSPSLAIAAESESTLGQLILQGGWSMFPLGACSLALLYLIIHCYRETSPRHLAETEAARPLIALCEQRDVVAAQNFVANQNSLAARAIHQGLLKSKTQDSEAYDNAVNDMIAQEENVASQWILYLSVIANAAPMIGLLGTVSGMIGAFQTMSAGGMGRPELLAGDIGEALITTATGLCIGIPAMVAYSYFNNRLNNGLLECARLADSVKESLFGAPPASP